MEKEQIISRATVLANRIRENRGRLQKDAGALALFNNLMGEAILLLKETKFFLNCGNEGKAAEFLTLAEAEYSRFSSKKGN